MTYAEHYHIISFNKMDYGASLNNTRVLESMPNFAFVEGDVTSPDDVSACLNAYHIDTLIHSAAR